MSLDWEKFKERQRFYFENSLNGRPVCSNKSYINQCALRVTNSLIDAGWPFNGPNQPYSESRFGPLCEHGHARGAKSLADYLEVYLTQPRKYTIPIHPISRQKEGAVAGKYIPLDAEMTKYKFFHTMEYMELKSFEGEKLRGIIYFNNPEHIDGFDLYDSSNTSGPYGIIGSQFSATSSEVRVFLI